MKAKSYISQVIESSEAGRDAGRVLRETFTDSDLACVIAYGTQNHDQRALLEGLRAEIGSDTLVVGASSGGLMTRSRVTDKGYLFGVMGLGGPKMWARAAVAHELQERTRDKTRASSNSLRDRVPEDPKAIILTWDPLCGIDIELTVRHLEEKFACPIVGGAAAQPWGPMVGTFQYFDRSVFSHGAVALALGGDISVSTASCSGAAPVGLLMRVTKARGNRLLELDGRPALDVWRELTNAEDTSHIETVAIWAIGIKRDDETIIRSAFGFDEEQGAVLLHASIEEGEYVMFHHRTPSAVLDGTQEMTQRLIGSTPKPPVAVIGFECAARAFPFLGAEDTLRENETLQDAFAPSAEWLGSFAWGEISRGANRSSVCNLTYPLIALS